MQTIKHDRVSFVNTPGFLFRGPLRAMEPHPVTLAERLDYARRLRRMTQKQLAARCGLSQSTIGNLEAGTRKSARDILAIAQALEVSPQWLETGRGTMGDTLTTLRPDVREMVGDLSRLSP